MVKTLTVSGKSRIRYYVAFIYSVANPLYWLSGFRKVDIDYYLIGISAAESTDPVMVLL